MIDDGWSLGLGGRKETVRRGGGYIYVTGMGAHAEARRGGRGKRVEERASE